MAQDDGKKPKPVRGEVPSTTKSDDGKTTYTQPNETTVIKNITDNSGAGAQKMEPDTTKMDERQKQQYKFAKIHEKNTIDALHKKGAKP